MMGRFGKIKVACMVQERCALCSMQNDVQIKSSMQSLKAGVYNYGFGRLKVAYIYILHRFEESADSKMTLQTRNDKIGLQRMTNIRISMHINSKILIAPGIVHDSQHTNYMYKMQHEGRVGLEMKSSNDKTGTV